MMAESSGLHMGITFSNEDKAGNGFLLSMDEVELVKNMALSLKSQQDIDFLNTIADKEFVTVDDKEKMHRIFNKAAKRIQKESTLTA